MNIRNGMTVYTVGPAPDNFPDLKGRECLLDKQKFKSINQAKKANGLNARTLQKGEKLPLTVSEANAALLKAA